MAVRWDGIWGGGRWRQTVVECVYVFRSLKGDLKCETMSAMMRTVECRRTARFVEDIGQVGLRYAQPGEGVEIVYLLEETAP